MGAEKKGRHKKYTTKEYKHKRNKRNRNGDEKREKGMETVRKRTGQSEVESGGKSGDGIGIRWRRYDARTPYYDAGYRWVGKDSRGDARWRGEEGRVKAMRRFNPTCW